MFDRSRKNQKVHVPEYTFSLLPLSLVRFGFCTNLVGFRFSSLNPLSLTPLTPSRLPRFSANEQNFKTFSKRERNGKDPSVARVDQGNDSKTSKGFGLFDWYGNTFLNFQK
jgi:hypothetical protein